MSVVAASPSSGSLNKENAATEIRGITPGRETSTKVHVFMSMQPVFIDLVHRPPSGGKSCMSGYSFSTCRQCCNTTDGGCS